MTTPAVPAEDLVRAVRDIENIAPDREGQSVAYALLCSKFSEQFTPEGNPFKGPRPYNEDSWTEAEGVLTLSKLYRAIQSHTRAPAESLAESVALGCRIRGHGAEASIPMPGSVWSRAPVEYTPINTPVLPLSSESRPNILTIYFSRLILRSHEMRRMSFVLEEGIFRLGQVGMPREVAINAIGRELSLFPPDYQSLLGLWLIPPNP